MQIRAQFRHFQVKAMFKQHVNVMIWTWILRLQTASRNEFPCKNVRLQWRAISAILNLFVCPIYVGDWRSMSLWWLSTNGNKMYQFCNMRFARLSCIPFSVFSECLEPLHDKTIPINLCIQRRLLLWCSRLVFSLIKIKLTATHVYFLWSIKIKKKKR